MRGIASNTDWLQLITVSYERAAALSSPSPPRTIAASVLSKSVRFEIQNLNKVEKFDNARAPLSTFQASDERLLPHLDGEARSTGVSLSRTGREEIVFTVGRSPGADQHAGLPYGDSNRRRGHRGWLMITTSGA